MTLQLLSFNDFHGHLAPPTGGDAALPGVTGILRRVGVPRLDASPSCAAGQRNSLTVAAGDLIGGSPIVSGLFKDEPAVEALNALASTSRASATTSSTRACPSCCACSTAAATPTDGCFDADGYSGARLPVAGGERHLQGRREGAATAAGAKHYGSWFGARTGRTILPPTWVTDVQGIKVGFIGMTLEDTPELVAQAGIKDVDFRDEVETAGLAARDLRKRGVQAIVVLIHEGGIPPTGSAYDFPCTGDTGASAISGPIVEIAKNLDPSIDMVVSGHTHLAYTCSIPDPAGNPREVTSAQSYGRLVTETNLQLDRRTKDVIRPSVDLGEPTRSRARRPTRSSSRSWRSGRTLAAPIANEEVAAITGDIQRSATAQHRVEPRRPHRRRAARAHRGQRRADRADEPRRRAGRPDLRVEHGGRGRRRGDLRRGRSPCSRSPTRCSR